MSLTNKSAIITGSSRGIGLAIAERYAAEGSNVLICSTNQKRSQDIADHLAGKYGVSSIGVELDIANSDSCKACVKAGLDAFGVIDILVNNAGISRDNLMVRMKDDDWNDVIQTNLNSVFFMAKPLLKSMMKNKGGSIINVSSVVGLMGNPGQTNYAASKAGVIGFTKSLAKEVGSRQIRVNAITPGFIQTDMLNALPKEYIDNIIKEIPLGRLGEPEDIADMTVFLGSDLARYITGQVFSVDGGIYM